jgi:tetratricopeptide (TPR) repeat protein
MSPRPAIFVSAVSRELKSARQLVANTLTFLGYDPEWQDIFGTEGGDLRAMLRRRIDSCKGVVQLVGACYGAEPPDIDERFGRVSYTQYEALYALRRGKKVWYLFLDESFPADSHEQESEEEQTLQASYRTKVKADIHLYHPLASREGLEASVLKLRDELTRLRRGVKRWAALVAGLLVLSVALSLWLLQSQQHSNEQMQSLQEKFDKLQQGVNAFAEVQNKVRQEQPGQKPEELVQRTYEVLGQQLGLDPVMLKAQLPRFAQELKKAPRASTYARANAAYVEGDYNEAERLALGAADEAQHATPPKNADVIKALELAAWAAEKRIEYADALNRLREAEKLTDRARDAVEWSRVQFAIASILDDQGEYDKAEQTLREVLKERERAFGPEHPDTLSARNLLATTLSHQGKYAEAEAEDRAVLELREKVFGPEQPETLATRNDLANALNREGKSAEAETEYRTVLKLREKVLGPEHPDTLSTRHSLGSVLFEQGKYAEAENECRAVLELREKVLGREHPDTLATRNNLGLVLEEQGKYAEAESRERKVIELREKVLGPEHPSTLTARFNLALALERQGKYTEAETEERAVIKLREKVLGAEHPDTLAARNNLAVIFGDQGKYTEAEAEERAIIVLDEKVLGPEHPDTLMARGNLAGLLDQEGKRLEAEAEERAVITLREKVLGPEHPDTLETRNGLANILADQSKYAEAEAEYRAVLKLREKALGPEHPATLRTCFDLAVCLRAEGEVEKASAFAQRAADGARKVLGPEHPDSKKYEQLRQELLAKNG